MSNLAKLSFEKAVELFEEWGFQVEEGPGHDEVTLIFEGQGHRSCCVYEVTRLPQIAAVALRVRQNIGTEGAEFFSTEASCGYQYAALHRMLN